MNTFVRKNNFGDLFDELFAAIPNNLGKQGYLPPVNITEDNESYRLQLVAAGLKKEISISALRKGC